MHPELRVVDAVLDDQRFLEPFRGRFSARRGRYTIPMETYLRMMYLKTKYQLGYESLVEEVTDSVSWRRFCRISLSGRVPDASTLTGIHLLFLTPLLARICVVAGDVEL